MLYDYLLYLSLLAPLLALPALLFMVRVERWAEGGSAPSREAPRGGRHTARPSSAGPRDDRRRSRQQRHVPAVIQPSRPGGSSTLR